MKLAIKQEIEVKQITELLEQLGILFVIRHYPNDKRVFEIKIWGAWDCTFDPKHCRGKGKWTKILYVAKWALKSRLDECRYSFPKDFDLPKKIGVIDE